MMGKWMLLSAVLLSAVLAACSCPPPPACPCAAKVPAERPKPKPKPLIQQCTDTPPEEQSSLIEETIDDTGLVRLPVDVFPKLPPEQRVLAYQLAGAALGAEDKLYFQRGVHEVKQLCELLVSSKKTVEPSVRPRLELFARRFWLNKGLYDRWTAQKIVIPFSSDEFGSLARSVLQNGATTGALSKEELDLLLKPASEILFARDTSSDRQAWAEPGIMRLVAPKATNAGNAGAERGVEFGSIARPLRAVAKPDKKLLALASYLETRQPSLWNDYLKLAASDAPVDVALGFAGAERGEIAGIVYARDEERTLQLRKLAKLVADVEMSLPWPDGVKPRQRSASVEVLAAVPLVLVGAAGPVPPLSIELARDAGAESQVMIFLGSVVDTRLALVRPLLESELRKKHGEAAFARCFPSAFQAGSAIRAMVGKGAAVGKGALSLGLEEAVAELVTLLVMGSPKLVEAGVIPEAKCMEVVADAYPIMFMIQAATVGGAGGSTPVEPGLRAASLVVSHALKTGALKEVIEERTVRLVITDYGLWQKANEELFKSLLEKVAGDQREVLRWLDASWDRRWAEGMGTGLAQAGIKPRIAFQSPRIKALRNEKGEVVDATLVESLGVMETALVDAGRAELP